MDGIDNSVENDIDNSIANKRDPEDGSGRKCKRERVMMKIRMRFKKREEWMELKTL